MVMSTDMSQGGVAHFPSFYHFTYPGFFFYINSLTQRVVIYKHDLYSGVSSLFVCCKVSLIYFKKPRGRGYYRSMNTKIGIKREDSFLNEQRGIFLIQLEV